MDLFRTVLLAGLVLLIWKLPFRGTRPIKEFFLWGLCYPFPFLLTVVMTLVIWGMFGKAYGLQLLFFDDNPLVQLQVGIAVMLLFMTINIQYLVLDPAPSRWGTSLRTALKTLEDLNAILPKHCSVQKWLHNDLVEKLDQRDLARIESALGMHRLSAARVRPLEEAHREEIVAELRTDRFRLLFAPAVLLVNGLVLVVLLGVIPTFVIPAFNGELFQTEPSRLPWFFGICLGAIGGVILTCWTSRWLAAAAGWGGNAVLAIVRGRACALAGNGGAIDDGLELPEAGHRNRIFGLLFAFFLIHAVTQMGPSQALKIDLSQEKDVSALAWEAWNKGAFVQLGKLVPWEACGILLVEATLGVLLVVAWEWYLGRVVSRVGAAVRAGLRHLLKSRLLRRALLTALLATAALGGAAMVRPMIASPDRLKDGFGTLVLLLLFFASWLGCVLLATKYHTDPRLRRATLPVAATCCVFGLILFLFERYGGAVMSGVPVVLVGASLIPRSAARGLRTLSNRRSSAVFLLVGLLLAAAAWASISWERPALVLPASAWMSLCTLILAVLVLSNVPRSDRPAMTYPLSAIFGFAAFAVFYNGLGDPYQAYMPAAASLACLIGLAASIYTSLRFTWPGRGVVPILGFVALAILLNGNAWFVTPNHFKLTFDELGPYYQDPVFLNSEAYFRATTPDSVKLRDGDEVKVQDGRSNQGPNQRLATAYVSIDPPKVPGLGLILTVEDHRDLLRARVGDPVRIVLDERVFPLIQERDRWVIQIKDPLLYRLYRSFDVAIVRAHEPGAVEVGGDAFRLVPDHDEVDPPPVPGDEEVVTTIRARPDEASGLILLKPDRFVRGRPIARVAIAASLKGRVTASKPGDSIPVYDVQLDALSGADPIRNEDLKSLRRKFVNCHLVLDRPGRPLDRDEADPGRAPVPEDALRTGDCVVLEDCRGETPVGLRHYIYLKGGDERFIPEFLQEFALSASGVRERLKTAPELRDETSGLPLRRGEKPFALRSDHDHGYFVGPPADDAAGSREWRVDLCNADRIRPGDHLILRWKVGDTEHSGLFLIPAAHGAVPVGETSLRTGLKLIRVDTVSSTERGEGTPTRIVGSWQALRLLDNRDVLNSWKQRAARSWRHGKPPLVIVTVSGGGIRSSVWTMTVLKRLETELGPAFPYHIRLITGASGGMVGATDYVTTLVPPAVAAGRAGGGERTAEAGLHDVPLDELVRRTCADQLDVVAGHMAFADFPSLLSPFRLSDDRGKALERVWIRLTRTGGQSPLERPLRSYADDEALGWRPSLIYTPMMVEDGRRLLISNLDLSFVTRNVGSLLLESDSRKIRRTGNLDDRHIRSKDDLYSLSAVEFYRLFPNAWEFRVASAVRMSASFPLISPAVSLPTLPPRRVVDAGYYDNYGINLSALWLAEMHDWLVENTSGVLIVQIRDHVSQKARTEIDSDRYTDETAGGIGRIVDGLTLRANQNLLSTGLQALSSPFHGVSAARLWTMSFRNDEQVELLNALFDGDERRLGLKPGFFTTVVFECPVEASLTWKLSDYEQRILRIGLGQADENRGPILDYFGASQAILERLADEHFEKEGYEARRKALFDRELAKLGFSHLNRLSVRESEDLYKNVLSNLKRLEFLRLWWQERR